MENAGLPVRVSRFVAVVVVVVVVVALVVCSCVIPNEIPTIFPRYCGCDRVAPCSRGEGNLNRSRRYEHGDTWNEIPAMVIGRICNCNCNCIFGRLVVFRIVVRFN